nr:hypothetical protein TetV2_00479 [Oceanusvirus sp.]
MDSTSPAVYRASTAVAGVPDVFETVSGWVWYSLDYRTLALTVAAIVFASALHSLLALSKRECQRSVSGGDNPPAERAAPRPRSRQSPSDDVPPRPHANAQLTAANIRRMEAGNEPPRQTPAAAAAAPSSAASSALLRSEKSIGSSGNTVLKEGIRQLVEFFQIEDMNHCMENLRQIRKNAFKLTDAEVNKRCIGSADLRIKYSGDNKPIAPPEPFHAAKAVVCKLFPRDDPIAVVNAMKSQIRVMYGRNQTNDKFWNIVWLALVRAHPDRVVPPSTDSLDTRVKRTVQNALNVVMEQEIS